MNNPKDEEVEYNRGSEGKVPSDRSEENDRSEQFEMIELDQQGELDPFEINFLPEFRGGRGPDAPFINQYGVLIGDHEYTSKQSPLEQWTEDTDPAVMAGDQWIHPFKDIGFWTVENRDYFEKGIRPENGAFMHPPINTAREKRSD